MWDSVLLAHADRSRVIPHRPTGRSSSRRNGDVLPTVLVDGFVAGVWRPVDAGIEVTAFGALPDEAWAGIEREARGLLALLADRDPGTYRRYGRWWATCRTTSSASSAPDRRPRPASRPPWRPNARRRAGLSRSPAARRRRTSSRLSTSRAPAATIAGRCSSGMS